jgi:hypothetical protein
MAAMSRMKLGYIRFVYVAEKNGFPMKASVAAAIHLNISNP